MGEECQEDAIGDMYCPECGCQSAGNAVPNHVVESIAHRWLQRDHAYGDKPDPEMSDLLQELRGIGAVLSGETLVPHEPEAKEDLSTAHKMGKRWLEVTRDAMAGDEDSP